MSWLDVLAQEVQDPDVQVDPAGLPIVSFGELLTFLIRAFFFIAGIVSIHAFCSTLFFQHWVNRLTGYSYKQYIRSLAPATVISVFILFAVLWIQRELNSLHLEIWIGLAIQILVGLVIFLLSTLFWPGDDIRDLAQWFLSQIPILRNSAALSRAIKYWEMLGSYRNWIAMILLPTNG